MKMQIKINKKNIIQILIFVIIIPCTLLGCEEKIPENIYSEVVTIPSEIVTKIETTTETIATTTYPEVTTPTVTHIYYDYNPKETTKATEYIQEGDFAGGYDEQKLLADAPTWYMNAFNTQKDIIKGGLAVDDTQKVTINGWAYIKVVQDGIYSKTNLIDKYNSVFYDDAMSELDVIYKDYKDELWRIKSLKASTMAITNLTVNEITNSTYNSATFNITATFIENEVSAEKSYNFSVFYDNTAWKVESFTYPTFK